MMHVLHSMQIGRVSTRAPHNRAATFCLGCLSTLARMVAYMSATVVGLGLIPALIMLADRGTILRWSNDLLDLMGH